ncbi:MAG TPA: 6-pyruvoyl-tetrahydropterin synthase-related protein [Patescibacteria group bacterium]|nr:6-pyruvoyl-tetrahydropterin synthase-related protein [Patescibacteria group bacterium]
MGQLHCGHYLNTDLPIKMFKDNATLTKIFLFFVIGLLFLYPLFTNKFYLSHDGQAQVARFGAYLKAFNDGDIPLRWAGDLNYRYGSPVLIFYYPLPGILSIPLYELGATFESAFKIIVGFSFILSFISFYLWMVELTKNKDSSFLASIVYGLLPYHFLNLYVRGDIAESLALAIAPLVFYSIEKLNNTKEIKYAIYLSVLYSLLILSHNSVSLLMSPIILIYSLIRAGSKKISIISIASIIIGLFLSSFFWLPALLEAKYTNSHLFVADMYKNNFPSFVSLIYSKWGFGASVNDQGGLSPQIGIVPWIFVLMTGLLIAFKKIKLMNILIFWMIIFIVCVFLTIKPSIFFWQHLPLLSLLQFPWRFVGIASFAAAAIVGIFSPYLNKDKIYLLSALIIIYSFTFIKIQGINPKSNQFYLNYPGTTYYHGQASSIWTAGDFGSFPKKSIDIIGGKGKIADLTRKNSTHTFSVDADTELKILDNTVYFPGWQVLIDGVKNPIEFQDMYHRGLITFNVPKGKHSVIVNFKESPMRLLSDIISLFGILVIIMLLMFNEKIDRFLSK